MLKKDLEQLREKNVRFQTTILQHQHNNEKITIELNATKEQLKKNLNICTTI